MSKQFCEIVVDSPFVLFKGFFMGFISCFQQKPLYYFHKYEGIRIETLTEHFKEWLGLETHVHLCIGEELADKLEDAIANSFDKLGIAVISNKKIDKANFTFKIGLYDDKLVDKFKEDINRLAGVNTVIHLKEAEIIDPGWQDVGVGAVNLIPPIHHAFEGDFSGEFEDILISYRKLKSNPLIKLSEIHLKLQY